MNYFAEDYDEQQHAELPLLGAIRERRDAATRWNNAELGEPTEMARDEDYHYCEIAVEEVWGNGKQ